MATSFTLPVSSRNESDIAARIQSDEETRWERWHLVWAAGATWALVVIALIVDHVFGVPHAIVLAIYAVAYATGGTIAAKDALADLFSGQVNVDLLMVTAAVGAACVNAWGEGAVLLALFATSNALEHGAMERTRHAVRSLMDLSPDTATLIGAAGESVVAVADLQLGDRVLVHPGERIPVDGVVRDGTSSVDQAAITGESVPVTKSPGERVFTASINQRGALVIEVEKLASDSTLAKIIAFVEDARNQKSRTQRFTDAFEGRYAVGVIASSLLVFFIGWVVASESAASAFYRAMTLLVVASPCALVISTPAATLSALANAARNGILFKGGNHLESAGTIRTFAFDKTGTLTTGHQQLTDVVSLGAWNEDDLLARAAAVEHRSEHHVARAIVDGAETRSLSMPASDSFDSIPGQGVQAVVDGRPVWVGNEMMARQRGIDPAPALATLTGFRKGGRSAVLVGDDTRVQGVLAVADTIRPDAGEALTSLRRAGVERIVMLTGDNQHVAEAIGRELGITEIYADLLPEEKLRVIERLSSEGPVAMVGDGVNDAPALAVADLGIAMGGSGTDVALETADVVLMRDTLGAMAYGVELGRRTRRTIVQNLAFALTVIAVLVVSALSIGIPLPLGVVGHEGSTIIVVLSGLRLLRTFDLR